MLLPQKLSSVNQWLQVSACFIEHEGKILLLKRPQKHKFSGKWIEPGGKIDDGETHEQTMVREIFEETGIKIYPGNSEILGERYFFFDDLYIAITFFHYTSKTLPKVFLSTEEGCKYIWIHPKEALKLDLIDDLGDIISEFFIDKK